MTDERARRWRLVLGEPAADAFPGGLDGDDAGMDRVLDALYDTEREAGLGASSPSVARWLGDIRTYFPSPVVRVLQQDALERLGLQQMLLEPELLGAVEPDVHLVATLLSLSKVVPARTRDTARQVVRKVAEDLERRLREPLRAAVRGALDRGTRTRRPRPDAIDWPRTIHANLRHWVPDRRTVVPERLIGHARRHASLRDVILCVDQSGSMAGSVVHASVAAAVLASIRALSTRLVLFDTAVVDLTDQLADPVDVLFGARLGGGTDIGRALAYAQAHVERPGDTVLVLISDLFEGGSVPEMVRRAASLVQSGVHVIALLALTDRGAPAHDPANAARLAALGIPCFSCTPDLFPELMATALQRRDVHAWAAGRGIAVARGVEG